MKTTNKSWKVNQDTARKVRSMLILLKKVNQRRLKKHPNKGRQRRILRYTRVRMKLKEKRERDRKSKKKNNKDLENKRRKKKD